MVARQVRSVFDSINAGDPGPMLDGLARHFRYEFHGDHALGGVRTTRPAMHAWWDRVFRLIPGATFTVHDVLVRGGPRNTRIAVRSTVSGRLPDSTEYRNTVFQFMTLRWGKVVSVETCEDLQILQRALAVVAASGIREAAASPITDAAAAPAA